MLSLVFLCAQKVISDHASITWSLKYIPKELYPVLFKACVLHKKVLLLQQLTETWPFPVLCFRKLLLSDKHCSQALLKEKPNRMCVQAVIMGIKTYLAHVLFKEGSKQQLRILDMTGMHEDGLEHDPFTMSLWSRTVSLAKACIDIAKVYSKDEVQRMRYKEAHAPYGSVYVEVWVDLFVNSTSFAVLREALSVSTQCPLRLMCRDLRAEELSLRSTLDLLEFLSPAGVRQIDLRFNNLGLSGLNVLLPHMTKFTILQSLKLPYSNIDVRRLSPTMEEGLQNFACQLGQLCALKELNLGSSRLSGRLRQLLGGLQKPLESLELAFCYLLPVDLYYLSQSVHISCLKKVDLSGHNLSQGLLQPFQQLLTEISDCLLHLDIMECKLTDTHLSSLLPSLCRCSHLRYLGLFGNPISSQGLRTLLQNCLLLLPELQLVVYPFPVDCYSDNSWPTLDNYFDQEKLEQIGTEVQQMLIIAGRTDVVWTTDVHAHSSGLSESVVLAV
ncbi:leucine-rich repeat-containing protein 14 [Discoglossus pictus]